MNFINNIGDCFVKPSISIKDALKVMDSNGHQIVLVTDEDERLMGLVTDGDMRRAILGSVSLNNAVDTIMNRDFAFVTDDIDKEGMKAFFTGKRINHLVILDSERRVKGLVSRGSIKYQGEVNSPVVPNLVIIMAGGKGSRLDPFTKILPKPMIPIGDKPIVEHIMDRFFGSGFSNFLISVNYKKEIIKLYFSELERTPYNVGFIEEDRPLGTAGSLSLVAGEITDTIVVTNCDVIIETNYREILDYHISNRNSLTIVGSLRHIKVPYGVINLNDSVFEGISEKPEYDVLINTGLYYLEPDVLSLIPDDQSFDMPDLIDVARQKGMKIGVYPVYNCWYDVGQWEEYRKTLIEMGFHE